MRISDWSSDVCSSDLGAAHGQFPTRARGDRHRGQMDLCAAGTRRLPAALARRRLVWLASLSLPRRRRPDRDRKRYLRAPARSEEQTSELQSLMRISSAVFCLKKKTTSNYQEHV